MNRRKTFDELTIEDNYMFSKVMLNENIAKHFLEIILNCKIREVSYPSYERTIDIRYDAKSIRLDIVLEDENHTVYNLEMQTTKQDYLVKRSRYYQDLIDLDLIEKGEDYDNLNNTIIIFICTFDPFGEGRYVYNFRNICKQNPELELYDGTEKVFVNTKGYRGAINEEFQQVLQYFNGLNVHGEFARNVEKEIERIKHSEKWRREFMTLEIFMNDAKKAERKLGREEGLVEGLVVGREEGLVEGLAVGREEGLAEGLALGQEEGQIVKCVQMVCKKLRKGKTVCEIAEDLEETEEEIQKIVDAAKKYEPDYDPEKICQELLAEKMSLM